MSKCIIDNNGHKRWFNDQDKPHREDGPAVEYSDGGKEWWINGDLHRENGPAVILANGYKAWYQNDKRHRLDGPAIEYSYSGYRWYYKGKIINCESQEEF